MNSPSDFSRYSFWNTIRGSFWDSSRNFPRDSFNNCYRIYSSVFFVGCIEEFLLQNLLKEILVQMKRKLHRKYGETFPRVYSRIFSRYFSTIVFIDSSSSLRSLKNSYIRSPKKTHRDIEGNRLEFLLGNPTEVLTPIFPFIHFHSFNQLHIHPKIPLLKKESINSSRNSPINSTWVYFEMFKELQRLLL